MTLASPATWYSTWPPHQEPAHPGGCRQLRLNTRCPTRRERTPAPVSTGAKNRPSRGPKNHLTFLGRPLNITLAMPVFWQRFTKLARGMGPSSRGSSMAHNPMGARAFISS